MRVYETELEGVVVLQPDVYKDERGYFMESWRHDKYNKELFPYLLNNFVQDNESCSSKGVFRGFHWQTNPMAQSKLVRVVQGKIIDFAICLIKDSPDFGKYIYEELSGENKKQLFIPKGYAHGFVSLEDNTIVNYKVDNYWSKENERCLRYDSINLRNIKELEDIDDFIISNKDIQNSLTFDELTEEDLF